MAGQRDPRLKPEWGTPLDRSHPLSRGLVARWLFNEGLGARAQAQGEDDFPLTPQFADPPLWLPSSRGVGSELDGPNDRAWRADDHPALRFGGRDFNCLVWVTPFATSNAVAPIIGKGNDSGTAGAHEWGVRYRPELSPPRFNVFLAHEDGSTAVNSFTPSAFAVAAGQEYLFRFGYDAEANSVPIHIVSHDIFTSSSPAAPWTHNGSNFVRLGWSAATRRFHGMIDQIILYDRPLTDQELDWLSAEPYAGFLAGPLRRWHSLPTGRPGVYYRLLQQHLHHG